MLEKLRRGLRKRADEKKAGVLQGFFKTGAGEYGEGEIFLGVPVPEQRELCKIFWREINPAEIQELLNSKIHEERLIGLLCLIEKYKRADSGKKKEIFEFYLRNLNKGNINNWDLIDLSAPKIAGDFLLDNGKREILYLLANSGDLWKKRAAVVSCLAFIREKDFDDCIKISEILLNDRNNLIHKAVGWMLREIGKRDKKILENFLEKNCRKMPRTMLRYAIEKFGGKEREKWLRK